MLSWAYYFCLFKKFSTKKTRKVQTEANGGCEGQVFFTITPKLCSEPELHLVPLLQGHGLAWRRGNHSCILHKTQVKPGVVVHACHPITQEAEEGGFL